jgi:hypothetical protein
MPRKSYEIHGMRSQCVKIRDATKAAIPRDDEIVQL